MISIWRRHVSAVDTKDPVLGPWRSFAALPADQFKAKAAELAADLDRRRKTARPRRFTRWSPRLCWPSPPASMSEVVERYVVALCAARDRAGRTMRRSRRRGLAAGLPEPEWESLRKAIFEAGGALAINNEGMRFILDQSQREPLREVERCDPAAQCNAIRRRRRGRW